MVVDASAEITDRRVTFQFLLFCFHFLTRDSFQDVVCRGAFSSDSSDLVIESGRKEDMRRLLSSELAQ